MGDYNTVKPPLLSDRVQALALGQRDAMVEWVCQPGILALTQAALEARLRMGTRDGVRNVLDLMGFLRDEPRVQIEIDKLLVSIGVQDNDELKRRIQSSKEADRMLTNDPREAVRQCVGFLLDAVRDDPTMRRELAPLWSEAEVMDESAVESRNGHT